MTAMSWDDGLGLLGVGTDDGTIEILSVAMEKEYKFFSEVTPHPRFC